MKKETSLLKLSNTNEDENFVIRLSSGSSLGGSVIVLLMLSLSSGLLFLATPDKSFFHYIIMITICLSPLALLLIPGMYSDILISNNEIILIKKIFPFQIKYITSLNEITVVTYQEYYNYEPKVRLETKDKNKILIKFFTKGRFGISPNYSIVQNKSGIDLNIDFEKDEYWKVYTRSFLKILEKLGVSVNIKI